MIEALLLHQSISAMLLLLFFFCFFITRIYWAELNWVSGWLLPVCPISNFHYSHRQALLNKLNHHQWEAQNSSHGLGRANARRAWSWTVRILSGWRATRPRRNVASGSAESAATFTAPTWRATLKNTARLSVSWGAWRWQESDDSDCGWTVAQICDPTSDKKRLSHACEHTYMYANIDIFRIDLKFGHLFEQKGSWDVHI